CAYYYGNSYWYFDVW
nr:immunoglobulin heavy chain junction region [Mus musculus]